MEELDDQARISATLEAFLVGLHVADPEAGFGRSSCFDSAIWSVFSLLEGSSERSSTAESLTKRLSIVLGSEDLSPDSRQMLEAFEQSGNLWGGGSSICSEVLPRVLGVALCEPGRERRVERAAEIVAITHFSPLVVQSSIALVEFQAALLLGDKPQVAIAKALEVVDHPEVRDALQVDHLSGPGALSAVDSVVEVVRWVVWVSQQHCAPSDLLEDIAIGSGRNPVVVALSGAVLGSQGQQLSAESCPALRSSEIAAQIVQCRETVTARLS